MFGKFRSLMTSFFATVSPPVGMAPMRKGAVTTGSPGLTRLGGCPRLLCCARALRSRTLTVCNRHRTVMAIGKISSDFTRTASLGDLLCNSNAFALRTSMVSFNIPNVRLTTRLKLNVHFSRPLRVCTPHGKRQIGLSGPASKFARDDLCSPNIIFTMGRTGCSTDCVLASLQFTHGLFKRRKQVSTIRLALGGKASIGGTYHSVRDLLNSTFAMGSHCRRRRSIFHVVRIRGFVTCLFLSFVLLITYFGVVNSVSVLVVSGGTSMRALHGLNTRSSRVVHVFLFRKRLVSNVKTLTNVLVNLLLYCLRRAFKFVALNSSTKDFIVSTCPIDVHL